MAEYATRADIVAELAEVRGKLRKARGVPNGKTGLTTVDVNAMVKRLERRESELVDQLSMIDNACAGNGTRNF